MGYTLALLTKLTQWFCFTVIISLLPLGFSAFRLSRQGETKTVPEILSSVLSQGDILIVGVAITGDGIGEIIATSKPIPTILEIIVGAACVLLIAFLSYCYADFSGDTTQTKPEIQFAVNTSLKLFLASVIISGICKLLTI